MTAVDQDARTSTYAVELRAPVPLMRALKNALVCASTETHVPVLCGVQIHFDGTDLELQSTDRFVAFYEQVGVSSENGAPTSMPFQLLLPKASVTQAIAFLRSVGKTDPVTLGWEPRTDVKWAAGSLTMSSYGGSTSVSSIEGEPPTLRHLVPSLDKLGEVGQIGYGRHQIAALSKIEAAEKNNSVRISFTKPNGATRVDWAGERRTMLMMGRNLAKVAVDWGVPGL